MARLKKSIQLNKSQSIVIQALKESSLKEKFYWTGGTLLSHYYLQHRYSFDLDFFSDQKFSYQNLVPFLDLVKQKIPYANIEENKIYDRWEFIVKNHEILRFEFVYYNGEKKRLKPLRQYLGINIDSLEDLAANKVMAYFDRNQPKDLFDIYFLLKKKFSVNQLIKLTQEKFGFTFSEFMFWGESAKSLKLLSLLKPYLLEADKKRGDIILEKIKRFFLDKGRQYININIDK